MKRLLRALPALMVLAPLLTACGAETPAAPPSVKVARSKLERLSAPSIPPDDLADLVRGNTTFALELYHTLSSRTDNLFFSPYSISLALAMTYAGARGGTEAEMATTLHFTLPQDRLHPAFNALDQELASRGKLARDPGMEGFRLHIVNALWGQQDYTFLPAFLDTLAENYGAGMRLLDYTADPEMARHTINDWVSDETESRIQDLIPSGAIDELTRLVLTNAIYFKAAWQYPFDPEATTDGVFHLLEGGQVTVPMMRLNETFAYGEGEEYQAFRLPYYGAELSMVVLVPRAGQFVSFEASLDATRLDQILAAMESSLLALALPTFEIRSSYSLVDALSSMGMPSAFDSTADFSGMDGTRTLFISKAVHQAFVSVDEAGTEAAAATAIVTALGARQMEPLEVSVDRPFLFAIRDEMSGTILFLGRCTDPTSQ